MITCGQGWGILLTTTVSLTVVSHKFTNNLYPVSSPSAVINKQLASGRRLGLGRRRCVLLVRALPKPSGPTMREKRGEVLITDQVINFPNQATGRWNRCGDAGARDDG